MDRNNQERIAKFTWSFKEGEEQDMADIAMSFNAPNCIVKIGSTVSGILILNVIVAIA